MRIIFDDAPIAITPSKQVVVFEKYVLEITDIQYRPDNWDEFVEYFDDRPEHYPLTEREMWEFGATSMLNALMCLSGSK